MSAKITKKKSTALQVRGAVRKSSLSDATRRDSDDDEALVKQDDNDKLQTTQSSRQYSSKVNFDRSEVQMPKLRLGQSMSPEVQENDAEMGDWLVTGFEPEKEVVVVPVGFMRGRTLIDDDIIVCSSTDQVTGIGDPGGDCQTCPKAQWGKPKRGESKSTPPPCTQYFSYLVYSTTHQEVMTLDLRKTGMNAAKYINTVAQKKGFTNFAITLTSVVTKGVKGKYAAALAKVNTKLSDKDLKAAVQSVGFSV